MVAPGVIWLARDFRTRDNPALLAALADGPLLVLFFVDRALMAQGAASRWRLGRALQEFDLTLKMRTGGQGITILRGEPEELLPGIMQRLGARRVHQSDWPAPAMRAVQDRTRRALAGIGDLVLHPGHLLVHPRALQTGTGGAYRVYSPFARALERLGAERPAPDAPARLAAFSDPPTGLDPASLDLAPDLQRGRAALDHFALPAGETATWTRLDDFLSQAATYPGGRDRPDLPATSDLSEHLALGEISPRSIWAAANLRAELMPDQAGGIRKFLSEVIWREFAWHLLIDFPEMAQTCWRTEWEAFPWRNESAGLTDWQRADTGIALVDAGLRQMWLTGRMHNRVRMVVASWLTKHLVTDWRAGLHHFADCLTDWDPASNAMNWQWVAGCGPDAAPYFRVFNPELQAERYDPKAAYRQRWLAGYGPADGPEARAWADSIPRAWQMRDWRPAPAAAVVEGRACALAAFEQFRAVANVKA